MPTIERKAREKAAAEKKRKLEDFYADQLARAPQHIKGRLGKSSSLAAALSLQETYLERIGVLFDAESGRALKQEIPPDQGANVERRECREETVRALQEEYKLIWHKRGVAKQIAAKHGLNTRTVQKYIKDFPLK
jgi:hypothetical protein